jgi:hypothetical protein
VVDSQRATPTISSVTTAPLHAEEVELDLEDELFDDRTELASEEVACPQLGGHSFSGSQHFQLPFGQQIVELAPHCGLVAALQPTSTELAALL